MVLAPEDWNNEEGPSGWWAVENSSREIVAYFREEQDAWDYFNKPEKDESR